MWIRRVGVFLGTLLVMWLIVALVPGGAANLNVIELMLLITVAALLARFAPLRRRG